MEAPRVPAGCWWLILGIYWGLVCVGVGTRFVVKVVMGIVVKTLFTIVSPAAVKFGVSAGILFVMR